MPIYTLENIETGEVFDTIMKYEELKEVLASGHHRQILVPLKMISGRGDIVSKTPNGFRDVLRKIKDGSDKKRTTIKIHGSAEI